MLNYPEAESCLNKGQFNIVISVTLKENITSVGKATFKETHCMCTDQRCATMCFISKDTNNNFQES